MSTTAEREKVELAVTMRKLISPMFQQAVGDALATQDVCAFWEEIDAAIITGMEQYVYSLAEEAEREAAKYAEWDGDGARELRGVGAWLRQKAEDK